VPDPAKHAKLTASGFRLLPACVTCLHFTPTGNRWGLCALKAYVHAKHGARTVGVLEFGTCTDYASDPVQEARLAGPDYAERYS